MEAARAERAQLLDMVSSSTAALAATACRCDELKQQQQQLAGQLHAAQRRAEERARGLVAAAAAVADMKKALADLQEAVPAALDHLRREGERDAYQLAAAVTHSVCSKDKLQNTELFNRAMQVMYTAPPRCSRSVSRCCAEQAGGCAGARRA